MNNSNKKIMAALGRVCGVIETIESLPEYNGCATIIRRAKITLRNAIAELQEKEKAFMNWGKVVSIIQLVLRLFALIRLEHIKNYFNFCKFIYLSE